jgi:hypothetical protein
MYKAIEMFTDLQDDNFKYEVGDEYPRLGLEPSLARINELSGSNNRRGRAVIEEVKEDMPFSDSDVTEEDEKAGEEVEAPKKAQPKKKGGRKSTK